MLYRISHLTFIKRNVHTSEAPEVRNAKQGMYFPLF
jgi:hypothetical protein